LPTPGIRLVIFDWAGTTIDFGCFAPVAAFQRAFAAHDVAVTAAEARGPMGLGKREHLHCMLQMTTVASRWRQVHGRDPNESDLESLYRAFVPCQLEALDAHNKLVPGLLECLVGLRSQGLRIGGTTGYFRQAAEQVAAAAERQGYTPDCSVCAEDVAAGRPAPWMVFRVMEQLDIYPAWQVVKVGDTIPDIEEGRNAGAWSVGVTASSSLMACNEEDYQGLSGEERAGRLDNVRRQLFEAGAHAVIDSLAELPDLVKKLGHHVRVGGRSVC